MGSSPSWGTHLSVDNARQPSHSGVKIGLRPMGGGPGVGYGLVYRWPLQDEGQSLPFVAPDATSRCTRGASRLYWTILGRTVQKIRELFIDWSKAEDAAPETRKDLRRDGWSPGFSPRFSSLPSPVQCVPPYRPATSFISHGRRLRWGRKRTDPPAPIQEQPS